MLQIGTVSSLIYETLGNKNYLKLILFFGNKSTQDMTNLSIIYEGDQSNKFVFIQRHKFMG
jgi:hypothetical protein